MPRMRSSSIGGSRADDQTDGSARTPGLRPPGHPGVEWLGRGAQRRVRSHFQALQLARARVRRAAEQIREAVAARDERRDRLRPQVRVGRDRVEAQDVVQGHGLAGGGGADVAALGVGHERHVRRHATAQPLQGRHAGRPERLEEGQVRLDGRGIRQRRIDQHLAEPLDAGEVRGKALGQRLRRRIDAQA